MVCAESRGAQKKTMKVIKIQMQFLPRLVWLNIKSFFHEIFRVGRAYRNANPNNVKIWLKMLGLGKDRPHLLGSGVSLTHASSARILSIFVWVRRINSI